VNQLITEKTCRTEKSW